MSIEDSFGSFAVNPGDVVIKSELGKGHFAVVYLGSLRGTEVAVKKLNYRITNRQLLKKFTDEADYSKRQNHPNLIQLLGLCIDRDGFPMLIYERMFTDLETLMKKKSFPFSSDVPTEKELIHRLRIARDAAKGMAWLHGQKVPLVHRDLKPPNLLLSATGCVKITDYGLSQLIEEGDYAKDKRGEGKGSPLWMAPEVLRSSDFDKSIDVYSFGIILWQILTGAVNPFPDETDLCVFTRHVYQGKRPDLSKIPPYPELKKLIIKCWSGNPAERPKFTEIVNDLCNFIGNLIFPAPFVKEWWETAVGEVDSVDWDSFVSMACDENEKEIANLTAETGSLGLGIDPFSKEAKKIREQGIEVLKRIFEQNNNPMVPLRVNSESFGNLLKWIINITPVVELTNSFFDSVLVRVHALSQLGYFFGFMSGGEAQRKIEMCDPGTFLLRFSASVPGVFTVTYLISDRGERKVNNIRILYNPTSREFYFDVECQPGVLKPSMSLVTLIESGRVIGLTEPLRDSPLSLGIEKPVNYYLKVL